MVPTLARHIEGVVNTAFQRIPGFTGESVATKRTYPFRSRLMAIGLAFSNHAYAFRV